MNFSRFISLSILCAFAMLAHGQTIEALKAQKEKTAKEISFTTKLLNETGKNTQASLNKLSILGQQIELRHKMIDNYNSELTILEQSILDNIEIIEILTADLEKVKADYVTLIQQSYRNMGAVNQLLFVLSSESFNQAYKRILYTKQIAQFRKKQAKLIQAIQLITIQKVEDLSQRKGQQTQVLNKKMDEFSRLNTEKEEQSKYYSQLRTKERDLRKQLDKQRAIEQNLQNEIEKLITEDAKKNKSTPITTAERTLSDSFEKNKGRFPWPTEEGVITDRFGEHAHPVMKNLIIKNNGVDITTNPGGKARAIFNGTVSKVILVPGGNSAVIIRHGQYLTVYSNLSEIYVRQGESIKTKQDIGLIYNDVEEGNKTVLKFQLRKEIVTLDPEQWLAR